MTRKHSEKFSEPLTLVWKESHLGHGADGAQRLAPEAVRFQALQVFMAADLGGEMSDGHHRSVRRFDPTAVVSNFRPVQAEVLLQMSDTASEAEGKTQQEVRRMVCKRTSFTSTLEAPASREFSISSFTTLTTDVTTCELDSSRTVSAGSCFIAVLVGKQSQTAASTVHKAALMQILPHSSHH